jgi:hypothetical protein
LLSNRKRSSDFVIAPKSSSVNDQLAAPTGIRTSREIRLHTPQQPLCTTAKSWPSLPAHVLREEPRRIDTGTPADVAERRQTADGTLAEQVTAAPPNLGTPDQQADNKTAKKPGGHRFGISPF